jgi:putative DNA primase/helicase
MSEIVLLDRKNPLPTAREFRKAECPTLVYVGGEYFIFNGRCYEAVDPEGIRKMLYACLEPFHVARGLDVDPFKPTRNDIDNVADALRAVAHAPLKAPAWIRNADKLPDPRSLIVASNAIFRVGETKVHKVSDPTPNLFTLSALEYPLERAPNPERWLAFLNDIFEGDQQQIDLLGEWFGYCMTGDVSQQKMLLLVGPKRSGKGTIARIQSQVVGEQNRVAQSLSDLAGSFGLQPLIGKTLAIVSDARLGNRIDQAIIIERLLSISGEDALTINRKNKEQVTTKLSTRIMLLSNELPRLSDASGAFASRFLILRMQKSYLGHEDTGLTDKLLTELPGIAVWAVKGLIRLLNRGRFAIPDAERELRRELDELSSPISAFVRECCSIEAGSSVAVRDLYRAWHAWCEEKGNRHPGTEQTFGRDLRAVLPSIAAQQPRAGDGSRYRCYAGVKLNESGWILAKAAPTSEADTERQRQAINALREAGRNAVERDPQPFTRRAEGLARDGTRVPVSYASRRGEKPGKDEKTEDRVPPRASDQDGDQHYSADGSPATSNNHEHEVAGSEQ